MSEVPLYRDTSDKRVDIPLGAYRGTLLIRDSPPVGPYSSPMPWDIW